MNLFRARHEGAQAFQRGEDQAACPFPAMSEEQGAWLRGWNTARFGATDPVSTPMGTREHEQRIVIRIAGGG